MLASIVTVIVVLGGVNGIPWDRCCLSNHQLSAWTKFLLTKTGWRNPWVAVVQHCFRYHWMGCMWRWAYFTDCSVAAISPSKLRNWCAGLYAPTLEKDPTPAISAWILNSGRYRLPRSIWNLTPMYMRSCVWANSDFFRFTTNPA